MDTVSFLTACAVGLLPPASGQYAGQLVGARIGAVISADHTTNVFHHESSALSDVDRWQSLIDEASHRFDVPAAWIRAVMRAESGGRTMLDGYPITSRAGAMGLMQVMPETYEEMRRRYGLGSDPYDPRDNILAGVGYLREMYDRYGCPGCFAAYNAGPAKFDEHLLDGRPLPEETQRYLAALNLASSDMLMRPKWPSRRELLFTLGMPTLRVQSLSPDSSSVDLFVPLSKDRLAPAR